MKSEVLKPFLKTVLLEAALPALAVSLFLLLARAPAMAYPPGPFTTIYGTVRDQYGTPISSAHSMVIFQSASGVQLATPIVPGSGPPGVNYMLKVPLDSGVTSDAYRANVPIPGAAYKLVVVVGSITNLPIQMGTNYLALGQWAHSTRVDLTLGVDSNGDGIPDAWEYAFLSMLGLSIPLSQLNANSVLTPDGLNLWQQFLLGTALFDPGDPLKVVFVGFNGISPILQFPTVLGRSYTVLQSPDLKTWSPAAFNLAGETAGAPTHSVYVAPNVAALQVYVVPPPLGASHQFYRVTVQ